MQENYVNESVNNRNQFIQFLLQSTWLLGLLALGLILIVLGVVMSGLISGIVGTYGVILVVICVVLYAGLGLLELNRGL